MNSEELQKKYLDVIGTLKRLRTHMNTIVARAFGVKRTIANQDDEKQIELIRKNIQSK